MAYKRCIAKLARRVIDFCYQITIEETHVLIQAQYLFKISKH